MKIAIIQPRTSYFLSGSEKISIKHSKYLSKLGHKIDLYTSTFLGIEETELFKDFLKNKPDNVNIFRYDVSELEPGIYDIEPDREHSRWKKESIAFSRLIAQDLRKNKPDIILSYYLPDSLFKPKGIPNVVYLAGTPSRPVLEYENYIKYCKTIAISSTVAKNWSDQIKGFKPDYVLGTGVDYPISYKPVKARYKNNIVFAGRLIERKGIMTLLDSFKEVIFDIDDVHLWILGDGELREEIMNKIIDLRLVGKVTVPGLVNNPYDYFSMATVCVFPSHSGDGLMGTVLESMALGNTIIATTNNGNEDVIKNGESGILVEPKNTKVLAESIVKVIKGKDIQIKLGTNAQKFIEENVAWDKNIIKLSKILEEIIEDYDS